jgi:sugar phosphate permease
LLAAGISQMNGVGGLAGWRWIFILEGIMTVLCGLVSFAIMPDLPESSGKWLHADEIRYLHLRQLADVSRKQASLGSERQQSTMKILWSVLSDWQLYLQALTFWGNSVANNGLKFSMPQIIAGMGFTSTHAQLLTVPPYIVGAISSVASAMYADRVRWRMPFVAVPLAVVIVANAILFAKAGDVTHYLGLCYFAVVLECLALYPLNPATSSWTVNNLAGPTKRSLGIAFMICLGNSGSSLLALLFSRIESLTNSLCRWSPRKLHLQRR